MSTETHGGVCSHGLPVHACYECGKAKKDLLPEPPLEDGMPSIPEEDRKMLEAMGKVDGQVNEITALNDERSAQWWRKRVFDLKMELMVVKSDEEKSRLRKEIKEAKEEADRLDKQATSRRNYKNGMPVI